MRLSLRMNFRTQLAVSCGALSLFVVAVAGLGVWRLEGEQERFSQLVSLTAQRMKMANEVLDETQKHALATRNLLLLRDPAIIALERESIQSAHTKIQAHLAQLKSELEGSAADPVGSALVADLTRIEAEYSPVSQRIVGQLAKGQKAAAEDQIERVCRPLLLQMSVAAKRLTAHMQRQVDVASAQAEGNFAASRHLLLAAGALALLAGVAVSLWIARAVTQSLGAEPSELAAVARRIADGDLDEPAGEEVHAAPPGSVMAAMRHMQTHLRRIVHEVRAGSDSIATASSQITQGHLSLQATSATMAQHWATVCRNADTARQASEVAASASVHAECGGEAVTEVAQAMEALDASTQKIASIIKVIDGIAFQTNILAMNAAVEAARAGEQGRGFAVVANEVRNLAQRSATAAREIKHIVDDCVDRAEQGSSLAQKATRTMVEVVASIRHVADLMSEISETGSDGPPNTVRSPALGHHGAEASGYGTASSQAHAQAALVQEGVAAADSLRDQAKRLVSLVAAFRVEQAALKSDYAAAAAQQAIDRAAQFSASVVPQATAAYSAELVPQATASAMEAVAQMRQATMAAATAAVRDDDWTKF